MAFGKLLLDTFRESDVIGRIGGDEFTVLFSGAGNAKPMEILARFSKAVFDYNERGNRGYDITYSVGLSESGVEWISLIVDLLRAADAQMNRQKLYK